MPRWPSDWLGLSPEASHTARVAGSHRTNGFAFSNAVELDMAGRFPSEWTGASMAQSSRCCST
ncbi:hypothetical protein BRN31_17760 [Xanthomonas oryzae pv. oryzae]|nr:hypothetical protein BRN91_01020 [Xanthomonas oryzae pv. oryzae]RBL23029.1 hypothetical protein BRN31_17760 [Xanthomonas oryzae pv. oryzae]RBL51657.1 hypothetical protein BRN24_22545 [Xanthomonas oryzae pv. oryzae]